MAELLGCDSQPELHETYKGLRVSGLGLQVSVDREQLKVDSVVD